MRYVHQVRKGEKLHLYFRKAGCPRVPLAATLDDAEVLQREVDGLVAAFAAAKPLPATLGEALRVYELEDADFAALADSTKYEYRLIMKELEATLGFVPIRRFTPAYVLQLRDAWAVRGHRCANVRRQVLKNVLKRSLIGDQLEKDPFAHVGQARRPDHLDEPHPIWEADVVNVVIRAAIARRRYGLARAVAIARFAGARRGDLVALRSAVRAKGRFRFLSGKRKVPVDLVEDPELAYWLDLVPDRQDDDPRRGRKLAAGVASMPPSTLVFTVENGRYTPRSLGVALEELVALLHTRGALEHAAYDLHGLRHTRGVELALAGCTDAEGAAMMGHASPASFRQYRRQADRIRLAESGAAKVVQLRASAGVNASGNQV